MVKTIVRAMTKQIKLEGEPQIEVGPRIQKKQVKPQASVKGVMHVSFCEIATSHLF